MPDAPKPKPPNLEEIREGFANPPSLRDTWRAGLFTLGMIALVVLLVAVDPNTAWSAPIIIFCVIAAIMGLAGFLGTVILYARGYYDFGRRRDRPSEPHLWSDEF